MKKIILFISIIFLVTGCAKKEEIKAEKTIRPVKYYTVSKQQIETKARVFSGFARPSEQSKISFKLNGTIQKINVKVGDFVKKNDVIAQLDTQIFSLQLQEAENALLNIQAQATNAESTYKRVQSLYEQQHASKTDLDNARTAYEMTQAGIKTVKTKIEQAKLQLSYTTIKSPSDGKVAYVLAKENENTGAGYPVVVLNYGDSIEIEISIPDSLINYVKKDDKVTVSFDVLGNKQFSGIVSEIGISPQLQAPTFPVIIKLEEQSDEIKAGMIAKVNFKLENNNTEFIYIPSVAVTGDNGNYYVFALTNIKDGFATVEKKAVKLGKLTNHGFELISGLNSGDLIVSAGISKISNGLNVKLLENN